MKRHTSASGDECRASAPVAIPEYSASQFSNNSHHRRTDTTFTIAAAAPSREDRKRLGLLSNGAAADPARRRGPVSSASAGPTQWRRYISPDGDAAARTVACARTTEPRQPPPPPCQRTPPCGDFLRCRTVATAVSQWSPGGGDGGGQSAKQGPLAVRSGDAARATRLAPCPAPPPAPIAGSGDCRGGNPDVPHAHRERRQGGAGRRWKFLDRRDIGQDRRIWSRDKGIRSIRGAFDEADLCNHETKNHARNRITGCPLEDSAAYSLITDGWKLPES